MTPGAEPERLADRVRALHVNERNGYGPGDCHCDDCCDTMVTLSELEVREQQLRDEKWKARDLISDWLSDEGYEDDEAQALLDSWGFGLVAQDEGKPRDVRILRSYLPRSPEWEGDHAQDEGKP